MKFLDMLSHLCPRRAMMIDWGRSDESEIDEVAT